MRDLLDRRAGYQRGSWLNELGEWQGEAGGGTRERSEPGTPAQGCADPTRIVNCQGQTTTPTSSTPGTRQHHHHNLTEKRG